MQAKSYGKRRNPVFKDRPYAGYVYGLKNLYRNLPERSHNIIMELFVEISW